MITKDIITPTAPVIVPPATPTSPRDTIGCLKALSNVNGTKQTSISDKLSLLKALALKTAKTFIGGLVEAATAPITALISSLESSFTELKDLYYGRNEIYQNFKREELDKIPKIPPVVSGAASCLFKGTIPLSTDSLDPTKNVVTTSVNNKLEAMPRQQNIA